MSVDPEDPHCPECGEPIGQTATYCMHCSADLTGERAAADRDGDGHWDGSESDPSDVGSDPGAGSTASGGPRGESPPASAESGDDEQLLDPDGVVDDTLTVVVGIAGGVVVIGWVASRYTTASDGRSL